MAEKKVDGKVDLTAGQRVGNSVAKLVDCLVCEKAAKMAWKMVSMLVVSTVDGLAVKRVVKWEI